MAYEALCAQRRPGNPDTLSGSVPPSDDGFQSGGLGGDIQPLMSEGQFDFACLQYKHVRCITMARAVVRVGEPTES